MAVEIVNDTKLIIHLSKDNAIVADERTENKLDNLADIALIIEYEEKKYFIAAKCFNFTKEELEYDYFTLALQGYTIIVEYTDKIILKALKFV